MGRGVHISDVFLGFRRVPHFVTAVRRDDQPKPWILRATIDSEVFTRLVRSGRVGLTGDAYTINRNGQYQTPPRFAGEILGQAPFSPNIAPPGVNVVSRETANGRRAATVFARLSGKDRLLVIDRDPSLPMIKSDRAQLQQVFLNLLNNALDAVKDGGQITVVSRLVADSVVVTVEDNGSGIPEELHNRIFDPFFTTKAPGERSGLGLSICHTIMKGLGGNLTFESAPGEGTAFRVRLQRTSL